MPQGSGTLVTKQGDMAKPFHAEISPT